MTIAIRDLAGFDDDRAEWDGIVASAPEAWIWATRSMHDFRVCVAESAGNLLADRSFIVLRDGRPCGLVPLIFVRSREDGSILASYQDVPLPWPMVAAGASGRSEIENALFDELERRSREAGAGMISLMLAPPTVDASGERFAQVVRERSFIDNSYVSQYVEISPTTLGNVRERYRRYVRKARNDYDLSVLEGDVPHGMAGDYMGLHVKDAGGVFRPLRTYERQIDLVRRGEGFLVTAGNKGAERIVGALIVSLYKGAAYGNSVAVDPEYASDPVSNLLHWHAIEHMLQKNISHYELGRAAILPTYLWQPSPKNYGISFFKNGWSRGRLKTVWAANKFYSRDCFDRFWERKRRALLDHCSL